MAGVAFFNSNHSDPRTTVAPAASNHSMAGGLGGVVLTPQKILESSGVDVAVTGRSGGVSSGPYESLNLSLGVGDDPADVLENRRLLAAAFGAELDDFVFARQVHGAGVRVVTDVDRGSGALSQDDAIPDTDALVTTVPSLVLAILTADCVPIVLHDPVAGVLACVHSGWRGTVARVAARALAAMMEFGSRPEDVLAGLGPAVDPAKYQVGADVHAAVYGAFGAAARSFFRPDPAAPDRWLLDLWAANRHVLREAGLREQNVHVTDIPTGGSYFSDRAERPCGRLALIARLRDQSVMAGGR